MTKERNAASLFLHCNSPRLDPHVNPLCGPGTVHQGSISSPLLTTNVNVLSRSSSAHSSESRPDQREVVVDCYWLPELNQASSSNVHNFADWIVQTLEEEGRPPSCSNSTKTPRALSPVLIPEMEDSLNLVCVPDLFLNSPEKLANEEFCSGSRYLF